MDTKFFLPLAEKMLKTALEEGRVKSEEELRLFMMVLHKLGKQQEIITLLQRDEGEVGRRCSYSLTNGSWRVW